MFETHLIQCSLIKNYQNAEHTITMHVKNS